MCTFKPIQNDKDLLQGTELNHMYQMIIVSGKDISEKGKIILKSEIGNY